MRFLCTKKNLNSGLQTTSRVIGGGATLPVLNNILFKTDKGRLRLSSTNLEIAVNTWVGGKIEEEGELTVPARLVNEYVNNLVTEKIKISTQNQNLHLEGEGTQTHIKGLAAEEFPLIPEGGDTIYAKLTGKDLKTTVGQVAFAAAFSGTQPEISGALFSFEGKTLTIAATDRYRLAEGKLDLEEEVPSPRQVILPVRAANEAAKVLGEGSVEVYLKEGQICFKTLDTELISRLIEGQYPDYKQIIPTGFSTEAEIERAVFIQSLKAASLFASENNNIELEFNPQEKQVIVRSQSAQIGDSEIRVKANFLGEKNSVIFNSRYLMECLNNLLDEKIKLKVINGSSPAEIVPAERDNYLYLAMPIKV